MRILVYSLKLVEESIIQSVLSLDEDIGLFPQTCALNTDCIEYIIQRLYYTVSFKITSLDEDIGLFSQTCALKTGCI